MFLLPRRFGFSIYRIGLPRFWACEPNTLSDCVTAVVGKNYFTWLILQSTTQIWSFSHQFFKQSLIYLLTIWNNSIFHLVGWSFPTFVSSFSLWKKLIAPLFNTTKQRESSSPPNTSSPVMNFNVLGVLITLSIERALASSAHWTILIGCHFDCSSIISWETNADRN